MVLISTRPEEGQASSFLEDSWRIIDSFFTRRCEVYHVFLCASARPLRAPPGKSGDGRPGVARTRRHEALTGPSKDVNLSSLSSSPSPLPPREARRDARGGRRGSPQKGLGERDGEDEAVGSARRSRGAGRWLRERRHQP